mgnify:FL=1
MMTAEIFEHAGCAIAIRHAPDLSGFPPHTEDPGFPPIVVEGMDRNAHPNADDICDLLRDAPPEEIFLRRVALCAALDLDPQALFTECLTEHFDSGFDLSLEEHLQERLLEELAGVNDRDRVAALVHVARALGLPAHHGTSNGYCQGDSVSACLVALPAWQRTAFGRATPVDPVTEPEAAQGIEAHLAAMFEDFAAWAFGDVYDYAVHVLPDAATRAAYGLDADAPLTGEILEACDILEMGTCYDRHVCSPGSVTRNAARAAAEAHSGRQAA